ncbi:hypothetical protein DEJ25_15260 [Curtobacterium sp. MCPF17_011]|uniref:putative Ig domain-containing protein n=1 Tax=Curtobacterium sp. MCPF17_011 TaxID=2175652 RepID=UPI000DAA8D90|nr:putative Ig domain-containing protein [Curtobacterium sp. MCPF17_011]PZF09185.1 hypothetical protein DEJ25_15260 [Curtobacterium sp. MCPF17_011]
MHRSTAFVRRACAVGTATALIGLTTGLGVMTATTAYAAEAPADTAATAPAVSGGDSTAPTAPGLPADAGTAAGAPTGTAPTAPPVADPTSPAPTATPTPTAGDAPTGTTPTAAAPTAAAPVAPTAVSTATVKLSGTAKVGSTLVATTSGFTKPTSFSYLWSVGGVATDIDDGSYVVQPGDVTKVVTVTVTNTLRDDSVEVASAKSAAVTQDPVFVDAAGKPVTAGLDPDGERFALDTTAGEAFSYTFRATGSPAPTFALAWAYPDEAEDDGEDPEGTPDDQLPDGVTFDAATGVLSGTTEDALYSEFAVTATSGGTTVTQYVELNVDAAAAAGVQVFSADRASFLQYIKSGIDDDGPTDGTLTSWIIDARGHVTTEIEKYHFSSDSWESETTDIDGGRPTVKQGGTLLVNGDLVDRFGNTVTDEDGNSPELAVTSDIASDVVREDPDLGDYGNFLNVTFPHASVHNLTAAAGDFATSFAVEVVPTATAPVSTPPVVTPPVAAAPIGTVPARTAAHAHAHGRLAYTGSDATDSLPWALAMLAAGAALVGLRTVRRRAQR